MKVLVVGGAGYIGSQTARVLRRAGLDVLIYDNLSTGFDFLAKGFEMVVGDIHDSQKLLQAVIAHAKTRKIATWLAIDPVSIPPNLGRFARNRSGHQRSS